MNISNNMIPDKHILMFSYCNLSKISFVGQIFFVNNTMGKFEKYYKFYIYFFIFFLKGSELIFLDNLVNSTVKFNSSILFDRNQANKSGYFVLKNIINEFHNEIIFENSILFNNNIINGDLANICYFTKKIIIYICFDIDSLFSVFNISIKGKYGLYFDSAYSFQNNFLS